MSELYRIKVLEKPNDRTCIFHIKVIHPDSMSIDPTPGFVLMLLQDNAGTSELSTMVDLITVMGDEWVKNNALGFIESVELISTKFEQPEEFKDDYDYEHEYWDKPSEWPEATIKVVVTDKAWCSHINESDSWETAAFDLGVDYIPCDPILFENNSSAKLEYDYKNSEGFIAFPKEKAIDFDGPEDLPEIVYFPKYHIPAYEPVEKMMSDDINPEKLEDWVGKPVMWCYLDEINMGVLAGIRNNMFILIHKADGGSGRMSIKADHLDWISLMAHNSGKKRQMQILTGPFG